MEKRRNIVTVVLLATAVLMIAAGAAMGQNEQVLSKATRICLECIGIG